MKRLALVCSSLLLFGCIDLEGSHNRCVDDGRCGAAVNDGGSDAGSSTDAGVDAGVDAGQPAYDGGTPCTGSANPRLRCEAPIQLATGSGIYGGQIVSNNDGFVVGWNTSNSIELRKVSTAGAVTALKTVTGVGDARFAIDARGSHWALIYQNGGSSSLTCATDLDTNGVAVAVRDGGLVDFPSVTVSAAGAVGVAALPSSGNPPVLFYGGHSTNGCPSRIDPFPGTESWNSAAVVHTSASGGDGFRYVSSSQINAFNGSVELMSRESDGGVFGNNIPISLNAPDALAASPSTSGQTVIVAFLQVANAGYTLGHVNTSADLSGDGTPTTIFTGDPGFWSTMACGAGCAGVAWLNYENPGPATIAFLSDDPAGTEKGRYDVVCALPPYQTSTQSVGSAYLGGKIAVVHTTSSTARLFLCDLPPL